MIRQLTTLSLLALVASCTTQKAEPPKPAFDSSRNPDILAPDLYPNGSVAEKEPVVRYGRYTLVSTQPESGQRDLMAQIIDVTIPANMRPNVRDAMQYVVDRSGYTLCPSDSGHVNILFTRPLPAAQYKIGPMTLRNALQVLAGPAWHVKVDEVNRQVCYVLRPGYQLPEPTKPAPTLYAKQSDTTPASSTPQAPAIAATSTSSSPVVIATAPTAAPIIASSAPSNPATPVVLPVVVPAKDGPTTSMPQALAVTASTASSKSPSLNTTPLPATAIAKAAPAPRPLPQVWTAETGSTLRESVEAWAARANWKVKWLAKGLDYPIEAPLTFEGTFQDAIGELFPLYDSAPRPFYVNVHQAPQRLIEVVEKK
ncbi:Pilus assembly protein PilL [Pseudomonas sp. 8Z]|uniref:PFGI-1 class ICE element type IV pilus protein PilL2 n=1 Tax=Pseudomonas sp. 8Z TaxID=2653166 RepID=UPI0012F1C760|nr:TcpQ domain-containing protein [Pseudomonas sp. 8Z]VXC24438.1 Pilus assembly protein PilL [Pseudomonas sp. 8Z]